MYIILLILVKIIKKKKWQDICYYNVLIELRDYNIKANIIITIYHLLPIVYITIFEYNIYLNYFSDQVQSVYVITTYYTTTEPYESIIKYRM